MLNSVENVMVTILKRIGLMLILFLFAISKHRTGFVRQSKTIPRTCQLGWHVLQGGLARQGGRNWERGATFFVGFLGSPPRDLGRARSIFRLV